MSDGLTGAREDWLALWKARAAALGLRYRDVDAAAGLTDGYLSRLMCGDIQEPTAKTIDQINRALNIRFDVKVASDSLHGVGESSERSETPQIERKHHEHSPLDPGPRARGISREIGS
jgi:transcriptional regulator with XRE-family HTH domain